MVKSVRTWLAISLAAAFRRRVHGRGLAVGEGKAGASGGGSISGGGRRSGGSTTGSGNGGAAGPKRPTCRRAFAASPTPSTTPPSRRCSGTTMTPSVQFSFPPDARQGPTSSPAGPAFTVNDAQRVDPVLADKLDTAALALVAEARANGKLAALAPCANPTGSAGEACAKTFVQSFGAKAYRRPLADDEINGLVVGRDVRVPRGRRRLHVRRRNRRADARAAPVGGVPVPHRDRRRGRRARCSRWRRPRSRSSMSYLLTAGPPDDTLAGNASAGMLATPAGREQEARRLIATAAGRARLVRVVREWLGIDDVAHREKATSVYPGFAARQRRDGGREHQLHRRGRDELDGHDRRAARRRLDDRRLGAGLRLRRDLGGGGEADVAGRRRPPRHPEPGARSCRCSRPTTAATRCSAASR